MLVEDRSISKHMKLCLTFLLATAFSGWSCSIQIQRTAKPIPTIAETVEVKVFFPRFLENDVEFVPVRRVVPRSPSIATSTLIELLKGPTIDERAQGLANPIPEGTKLKSVEISGGVARADFDERMEFQMGGSTRVMAIRQMIIRTLKQFPDIKEVIISVEGRTEDVLQP